MTKEERDITIKEHRWQREKEVLERKYKLKQEKREFNKNYKSVPAFRQSYIQKVLREKYNIHILIRLNKRKTK